MAVPVIAPSPLSELTVLAPSWERTLNAQNKSPRTIVAYLEGLTLFATYLRRAGMPTNATHVRREHVEAFIADQVARWRPSTARTRYRSLQQFFRWCISEGELIPHLFGATSRFPMGQRGLYCYWRTGANVVVPSAFRYLEVK